MHFKTANLIGFWDQKVISGLYLPFSQPPIVLSKSELLIETLTSM